MLCYVVQVLSAKAERFVLSLFDQFSSPAAAAAATTEASTERALTQEGQNEVTRVGRGDDHRKRSSFRYHGCTFFFFFRIPEPKHWCVSDCVSEWVKGWWWFYCCSR